MPPQLAISTLSLGSCDHHSLQDKLLAAAHAGFTAIDLFDADWEQFKSHYAKLHNLPPSIIDGDDTSVAAARAINRMCTSLRLRILCLQPFREFEARKDQNEAADRMIRARGTLSILPMLGTTMLLIPSTTLSADQLDPSPLRMAADLAQLADHAASFSPPLSICYEALSWGTHVSTWRAAWDVVKLANRYNLGLCLDSFNTAAREWADPYNPSGVRDPTVNSALRRSLDDLVANVPANRIFYFQLADGQRMLTPLTPPDDPTIPLLRPWSRSYRLFPLETARGAYLPVKEFTEAVLKTGYQGPWSLEVFNDSLQDPNPNVPNDHASRGIVALQKTLVAVGVIGPPSMLLSFTELSLSTKNGKKTLYRFLLVFPIASTLIILFHIFFSIPHAIPARFFSFYF
ncbi:xylose isomerase-like protein [Ramaria rubella]|nr:xylose isomerase-like protein [Ramaria rubella]